MDLDYLTKAKIEYKLSNLFGLKDTRRINKGVYIFGESYYDEIDGYAIAIDPKAGLSYKKFSNKFINEIEPKYEKFFAIINGVKFGNGYDCEFYIYKNKVKEFIQDVILPDKFVCSLIKDLIYFELIHGKIGDTYLHVGQDKLNNKIYVPNRLLDKGLSKNLEKLGLTKSKQALIKVQSLDSFGPKPTLLDGFEYIIRDPNKTLAIMQILQMI